MIQHSSYWLPIAISIVCVGFDLDFFRHFFFTYQNNLVILIIRITSALVFVYLSWEVIMSSDTIFLILVEAILTHITLMEIKCQSMTNRGVFFLFGNQNRVENIFWLGQQANIFSFSFSNTLANFLPGFVLMGSFLLCSTNYGIIKLYGMVNLAFYVMFPVMSFVILIYILFAYSKAANVYETSARVKISLLKVSKSKRIRTKVNAFRPTRISVGDQYYLKNNTKCTYLFTMFRSTLDLVLTFWSRKTQWHVKQ